MKIANILEAEQEAKRFIQRVKDLKGSYLNGDRFDKNSGETTTYPSKESASVKRASLDLTRALAKMRIETY